MQAKNYSTNRNEPIISQFFEEFTSKKKELKKFCHQYGIHPSILENDKDTEPLKVMLWEQWGNWIWPWFDIRVEILKILKESNIPYIWHKTGVYGLWLDVFTVEWLKQYHSKMYTWNFLPAIWLFPKKTLKQYEWKNYYNIPNPASAVIDLLTKMNTTIPSELEKIITHASQKKQGAQKNYIISQLWALLKQSLGASWNLPEGLLHNIHQHGIVYLEGIKDLLLHSKDKISEMITSAQNLQNCPNRAEFWRYFARDFYKMPIYWPQLDNLMNKMMLYIEDMEKIANLLQEEQYVKDNAIKFTHIVDVYPQCVPVYYDIHKKYFYYHMGHSTQILHLRDLQDLALQNKTTGPTAFLEYLMIMFMGYVMLGDGDYIPFIEKVKQFTEKKFNLSFPIVTIKDEFCQKIENIIFSKHEYGDPDNNFLLVFHEKMKEIKESSAQQFIEKHFHK